MLTGSATRGCGCIVATFAILIYLGIGLILSLPVNVLLGGSILIFVFLVIIGIVLDIGHYWLTRPH